jgi:hypothetical protein
MIVSYLERRKERKLAKIREKYNSKEDMLLFASAALVSLALQTYTSRRIFNYNNKSKEYEKRRIDASPNAPNNQNNLTIRHDRLENILSL